MNKSATHKSTTMDFLYTAHLLRSFFEDLDRWRKESILLGIETSITNQEYSDLFIGTDADIYIPLWASACKGKGDILVDKTTFEVIKFYKERGYNPIRMDGNPPDYIGEQLRFLEYLFKCALDGCGECEADAYRFIEDYALDTIKVLCDQTRRFTSNPEVMFVCDALTSLAKHEPLSITEAKNASPESILDSFDSSDWEKGDPIPIEDERMVLSSGINNCGGNCRIETRVREGCVLDLSTDSCMNDIQIRTCARGRGYRYTFLTSRRLRYPMKRIGKRGGGKFKRISWDEAADIVADKMKETLEKYGPSSRYIMYGTGVITATAGNISMERLLSLQGGSLAHYGNYSSACTRYITPYVLGELEATGHVTDVLNSKLIILWGHNPSETIFGPFRNYYLMKAKEAGTRIIVIDPRRSDTAISMADEWIPIRPGTDTALAIAMAYVILKEDLQDQHFMDKFCIGFDEDHMPDGVDKRENYKNYLSGGVDGIEKTPEWAEAITGVPAAKIKELAIEYATTKPASILPGLGVQRTSAGEQATRTQIALAALTGNIGVPGGGTGGSVVPHGPERISGTTYNVENPFKGIIPVFLWTKAIDEPEKMNAKGDGLKNMDTLPCGIKLMFSLASNVLMNQHSNTNDTARILSDESKCETIVLSDLFMTPSARWADVVLPAPSLFEVANIPLPWIFDDYILYCDRSIDPLFGTKYEYYWIEDVAKRLGLHDEYTDGHRNHEEWLKTLYDDLRTRETELPPFEAFKAKGRHVYKGKEPVVPFQKNIEKGIPFNTPSGKIEIFSKALHDLGNPEEIGGLPVYFAPREGYEESLTSKYPLQLIGYHTKRRTHSIHDQNQLMEELDPPAIWINPKDAAARDIKNGDLVEIFNDRGVVRIPAKVTDRIIAGACAMSQGGWYTPDKDGVDTRGSINVLTFTDKPTPVAKGNPQHSNLVEIRKSNITSN